METSTEFCVIKLCIWPALPRQNSPDLKHQIWTLKSSQCMQWNSHRWASTEIKLEGREKQECVRSKVQQPGATRNGAGEISPVKLSSFSLPTDDDDPLLWSPSFISSSHRERWTAPLKSDLHIESGSRDRGRKGERRGRNYWRSLRRRLPNNKGTKGRDNQKRCPYDNFRKI